MSQVVLTARALQRDYLNCPVCVSVEPERVPDGAVELLAPGAEPLAAQVIRCGEDACVAWIIPAIAKGQEVRYTLRPAAGPPRNAVTLSKKKGRVVVRIRRSLFTTYHYADSWARPFLHPLMGPDGKPVTRQYPMEQIDGETHDHIHHKGCFVAWGDVNGSNNWSDGADHAYVRHQTFETLDSGPVMGRVLALNHWVTKDEEKVMEETREYRFYALPRRARAFDLRVSFRATEGDVRFGDTKEGGICSVRVATSMDADKGGRIENSYGGLYEKETWGKRAHWCDYSGPVDGKIAGVTLMDHPGNFRHPTYWHVRDYGLMTANPFGLSYFHRDKSRDGSHMLPAGAEMTFRYRVFVHRGDAKRGKVAEQYHHYVNPPVVEVG